MFRIRRGAVGACLGVFIAAAVAFAPGAQSALDPTFGIYSSNSFIPASFGTLDTWGSDIAVQNDGKIIIAGSADNPDRIAVARYRADGRTDTTFSDDGKVTTTLDRSIGIEVEALALQDDGKIVIAGRAITRATGSTSFLVIRYTSSGALDTTFSDDGIQTTPFGNGATDLAIQADGKILVAGDGIRLLRYDVNGTLDSTFSDDGKLTNDLDPDGEDGPAAGGVEVQGDGRIVVAGSVNGGESIALLRFNADGSADTSFSDDGQMVESIDGEALADETVPDLVVQGDGKIILVGALTDGTDTGSRIALLRYAADGTRDNSFSGDGLQSVSAGPGVSVDDGTDVAVQEDGKIVVAGSRVSYPAEGEGEGEMRLDTAVLRFLADGSLDTTFSADGRHILPVGYGSSPGGLALDGDENIIIGGTLWRSPYLNDPTMFLARFIGGDAAPAATSMPTITGSTTYAGVVTCDPGEWPDSELTYEWLRNGKPVPGAVDKQRRLGLLDAGQSIACRVTAHGGTWIDHEQAEPSNVPRAATTFRETSSQVVRQRCSSRDAVRGYCYTLVVSGRLVTAADLKPVAGVAIRLKRVTSDGAARHISTAAETSCESSYYASGIDGCTGSQGRFRIAYRLRAPERSTGRWVRANYGRVRVASIAGARTSGTSVTRNTTL